MRDQPAGIFSRRKPTARQMIAVAELRFGDAEALVATKSVERANGAIYLAGLAIEILLKARLMTEHRTLLAHTDPTRLAKADRRRFDLVYRWHDLEGLLNELPVLTTALRQRATREGVPYHVWLEAICNAWTIYVRYASAKATLREATVMIARVRQLKELIR